jgi:L-amino acid N-acyltransferase YncA
MTARQNNKSWVRPATKKDLMRFFEWRNDPVVRASCASDAPVSLDTHTQWFEHVLRLKEIYVVMYGPRRILGHARVEALGSQVSTWHIYLNPSLRGKTIGRGKSTIKASKVFATTLLNYLHQDKKIPLIVGDVLEHNTASIRFHEDAGFKFVDIFPGKLMRYKHGEIL